VSFVLVEHLSIPEKVEAISIANNEPTVAPVDSAVVSESSSAVDEPKSWVEKVVTYLDTALADEGTAQDEI